jgi:hypothetical protein
MGQLMGAQGQALALALGKNSQGKGYNRGKVYLRAETKSHCNDLLHLQLSAKKLDNKDGMFGKSDPFVVVSRCKEDGTWVVVWKSTVVYNNLNPTWPLMRVKVQTLCNGDLHRPIKVDIWDYESSGAHQYIGGFRSSVQELIDAPTSARTYAVVNDSKKKSGFRATFGMYKNSGSLIVNRCIVEPRPSFLEYIRGGTSISLVVAIDYTASNGSPSSSSSLHYSNPSGQLNPYQDAIQATATILQEYDTDKLIPTFGFGGQIAGTQAVSHCFPLTFDPSAPEAHGVQGVLDLYKQSFQSVNLSGPTLFAPLINTVAQMAAAHGAEAARTPGKCPEYTVLLLLTDGVIMDMDQTLEAIVAASTLPLSIVIVGVGPADFSAMEALDSDDALLRDRRGNVAERDIVQFVPFRDFQSLPPPPAPGYGYGVAAAPPPQLTSGARLAAETLREIPEQLVSYNLRRGLHPAPMPANARDMSTKHILGASMAPGAAALKFAGGVRAVQAGLAMARPSIPQQQFQQAQAPPMAQPQGQTQQQQMLAMQQQQLAMMHAQAQGQGGHSQTPVAMVAQQQQFQQPPQPRQAYAMPAQQQQLGQQGQQVFAATIQQPQPSAPSAPPAHMGHAVAVAVPGQVPVQGSAVPAPVAAAPLAAAAGSGGQPSVLDQLKELANLRAAGVLSDAEFESAKQQIISGR